MGTASERRAQRRGAAGRQIAAAPRCGQETALDAGRRICACRTDAPTARRSPMPSEFRLMGVINVTPDSFSDGGSFLEADAAIAQGRRLAGEGADLLDVGGESTRPGAEPVDADAELARVLPVVAALVADQKATLSIDTSKQPVAEAALDAGARYVNDVTAFRADPRLAGLVADRGVECCLMHMLGEPAHHAGRPALRRRRLRRQGLPRGAAGLRGGRGHPRGPHRARPRHRLRQDRRPQPRAPAPPGRDRGHRPAGRDRHLAQVVPGPDHRPRRDRTRAREPRHVRRRLPQRGAAYSASTRSPRPAMPCS